MLYFESPNETKMTQVEELELIYSIVKATTLKPTLVDAHMKLRDYKLTGPTDERFNLVMDIRNVLTVKLR